MTRTNDIESVLEQWLAEGPLHMPDRLYQGTLERIERLPERRFAALTKRLPATTRNARLAIAASVLIAVGGASAVVIKQIPGAGAPPSPTPTRYVAPGFRPFGYGTTGTFSATVPLPGSAQEETTDLQLENPFSETYSGISIVSGIRPGDEPLACVPAWAGGERSPAALAAWLGTFHSIVMSPPQPATIGGLSGLMVDITERADASKACGVTVDGGGQRIELLGGGSWLYGDSKLRLFLLDRGDGESILIDIGTRDEPTWAPVDAAMSIVDGFEFSP